MLRHGACGMRVRVIPPHRGFAQVVAIIWVIPAIYLPDDSLRYFNIPRLLRLFIVAQSIDQVAYIVNAMFRILSVRPSLAAACAPVPSVACRLRMFCAAASASQGPPFARVAQGATAIITLLFTGAYLWSVFGLQVYGGLVYSGAVELQGSDMFEGNYDVRAETRTQTLICAQPRARGK